MFRHNFLRFDTPTYYFFYYLCTQIKNLALRIKHINMSITQFFNDAPVLATILTLAYAGIWVIFIRILFKMYKR